MPVRLYPKSYLKPGMCALAVALLLVSHAFSGGEGPDPDWIRVTDKAGWQPRDSSGEVVFKDALWILGGWFDSFTAAPRDVWSSADGKTWKLVTKEAPWKHSDLPMTLVFKDRMWLMGGWFNGRLPGHGASSEVWSSTDGKNWEQITDKAGWSPRIAAGAVVFRGRMWILGGTENYYFGDERSLKNDVWSSADGKEWRLETTSTAWSPRAYHAAVVHDGKIWVLGGGNYVPKYHALNDVWCAADGVRWERVTEQAPWHPRIWFSSVVYRDRIWVVGGWSNSPSKNWGDVWYSRDGKEWTQLRSRVIWKARHEHSTYVFKDKIWVAGGHAQPLSSDVWSLEVPMDWFPRLWAVDNPRDGGWVSLFNGKDLEGWVQRGGKAKYRVENGQIVGSSVPNTGNSFLCTKREYSDFVLELEFKVHDGLNSGVQIRSQCFDQARTVELSGKKITIPAGRVHGYQVEIDPSARAWTGGIYDEGRRGWLRDLKNNEPARQAFKPNAWNKFRIECNGDSIKTWLNGVAAAELKDSATRSGFIGLQVHGIGERTEPLEVRFRNLRIKE